MIKFKDVHFQYQDNTTFKDINLDIPLNGITFMLGENGSGKSTMLKLLLGLLHPKKGSILFENSTLSKLSFKEKAKYMAYIPQNHTPVFDYLVKDIIVMGCVHQLDTFEKPSKRHFEKAISLADTLGVTHLLNKGYKHISGGERQLVLIARALMQTSRVLIMDEPTANLDFGHQTKFFNLCQRLKKQGTTIIITSHNPNHALHYSDTIVLMHKKSCIGYGQTKDILTSKTLSHIYDIPIEMINTDHQHWQGPKAYAYVLER